MRPPSSPHMSSATASRARYARSRAFAKRHSPAGVGGHLRPVVAMQEPGGPAFADDPVEHIDRLTATIAAAASPCGLGLATTIALLPQPTSGLV